MNSKTFVGKYCTYQEAFGSNPIDDQNKRYDMKKTDKDIVDDKDFQADLAEMFGVGSQYMTDEQHQEFIDSLRSDAGNRDGLSEDSKKRLADGFEQWFRDNDKTPESEKTQKEEPFSWAEYLGEKSKRQKQVDAMTPNYHAQAEKQDNASYGNHNIWSDLIGD